MDGYLLVKKDPEKQNSDYIEFLWSEIPEEVFDNIPKDYFYEKPFGIADNSFVAKTVVYFKISELPDNNSDLKIINSDNKNWGIWSM